MRQINRILLIAGLLLASGTSLKAQITIGSLTDPAPFSVLELIGQLQDRTYRGMRLPQVANASVRPVIPAGKETLAAGLMVYNMETNCVEYWNGLKWIPQCASSIPAKVTYLYDAAGNRIKRIVTTSQ